MKLYTLDLSAPSNSYLKASEAYVGLKGLSYYDSESLIVTEEQFKAIKTNHKKGRTSVIIRNSQKFWITSKIDHTLLIWKELRKDTWFVYWQGCLRTGVITYRDRESSLYKRKLIVC